MSAPCHKNIEQHTLGGHPALPGRWGAASSSEPPVAAPPAAVAPAGDARLMPFLVRAAEAPSFASVALVKPESTGSHRWTKKEDGLGGVRGRVC